MENRVRLAMVPASNALGKSIVLRKAELKRHDSR